MWTQRDVHTSLLFMCPDVWFNCIISMHYIKNNPYIKYKNVDGNLRKGLIAMNSSYFYDNPQNSSSKYYYSLRKATGPKMLTKSKALSYRYFPTILAYLV